jgi:hypothetical protein
MLPAWTLPLEFLARVLNMLSASFLVDFVFIFLLTVTLLLRLLHFFHVLACSNWYTYSLHTRVIHHIHVP